MLIFSTNISIKMEARFKSLSIFEFQAKFVDDDSCFVFLAELKWKDGYQRPKYKNKNIAKE